MGVKVYALIILTFLFSLTFITYPSHSTVSRILETFNLNRPVGINVNGTLLTPNGYMNYNVTTNGLRGLFTFYGGSFYSGEPVNQKLFSLQLNANFNVTSNEFLWAQDVVEVEKNDSYYCVGFVDNIWNASGTSLPKIIGNGIKNSTAIDGLNYTYYYYLYPQSYITTTPFNITLEMFLTTIKVNGSTLPNLLVYFSFTNSTFSTGLILLDNVTIVVNTSNPQFLAGVFPNISQKPFIIQLVVGGGGNGAGLYVTSWNATVNLQYLYNGNWYTFPSAITLEPLFNKIGGITAEYVISFLGINETYQNGVILQTNGVNVQKFLWITDANITVDGQVINITVTPLGAQWRVEVSGGNVMRVLNESELLKMTPGIYSINAKLYVGNRVIYSYEEKVIVPGGIVKVISKIPFYAQGNLYSTGNYTFRSPVNLTFIKYFYVNQLERYAFVGVNVSGKIIYNNSIIVYLNATVIPIYINQYYLFVFPSNITGYVNGILSNVTSGWYNESSIIYIPTQNITKGLVRYIIVEPLKVQVNSSTSIHPKYYEEIYFNITKPVYGTINGQENQTITSGWYNYGVIIHIYKYYYINSTVRLNIFATQYNINLTYPALVRVYNESLEYLIVLNLPNGTIREWLPFGYTLTLPNVIFINSTTRYILTTNTSLSIKNSLSITPSYALQYLIILHLPNGTINFWEMKGEEITLPKIIYFNSYERYYLNKSPTMIVYNYVNSTPSYIKQYLVIINNQSYWYDEGSVIKLFESVPIFYTVKWVGNYTLPNGAVIDVNGFIVERAIVQINITSILGLITIILSLALLAIAVRTKKRRK